MICTCNKICTCIPVCQAHRVLHPDPAVRTMAEELLLVMGPREPAYMRWAIGKADAALGKRLREIASSVRAGAKPDPARWPDPAECAAYLGSPDEVIAIMAAQMLQQYDLRGRPINDDHRGRVDRLLLAAWQRPWYIRAGQG